MLTLLVLSSLGIALPTFAENGVITLTRDVKPRIATRAPLIPDPNPNTVSANPAEQVKRAVGSFELSDQDFARVSSGSGLQRQIMPDGHLPGLDLATQGASQGLPGMRAGHSGGAGSSIANQVNRSLQQGLAPLKILTGDR